MWCALALMAAAATATPLPAAASLAAMTSSATDDAETVRIAVGRFQGGVDIGGAALQIRRGDGKVISSTKGKVRITLGASGIFADGKALDRSVATITGGMLTLAGHSYRGALEVRASTYKGRRELLVVHPLELETYVTGIVSSELPKSWPLAAYQAQAVAARTFAMMQKYRRLDLPYHMESSVLDQVYHGVEREHALAEQAATSTRGQVLSAKRHLVEAYFHAACGGNTESAAEGWGTALDYLPGSPCGRCMTSGTNRASWKVHVSRDAMNKSFSTLVGGPVDGVKIRARTASKRVKSVELTSGKKKKTITGADFRRFLGWSVVWSTQIDSIALKADGLTVVGRGSGHGVGMCQWGAKGYGDDGVTYERILARYYPGATLKRLY